MGIFDRVERKLDRVINGAFARAFRAEVQPVEIAAAMRRAMDERAAIVGKGRTLVPNVFSIELDPSDYDRLTQYEDVLAQELIASVEEHVESQRYTAGGPLAVEFTRSDDLDTGVFRVRPTTAADAAPRRREPIAPTSSPSQRRFEARRSSTEDSAPVHRPRNLPFPPEATAHADGAIGMAGSAATAAAGAAAGTAAASRAGGFLARHEVAADVEARQRAEEQHAPQAEHPAREDEQRDGSWADGTSGPDRDPRADSDPAAHRRRPMRLSAHDDYDAGWDEAWDADAVGPGEPAPPVAPARQQPRLEPMPDMPVHRDDDATRVHAVAPPPLPDPAHRPWIELDGDTYPLLAAITVLGRDTAADITLDDPGVSRRHAEIRVTHDGPHLVVGLRDLGSTNGTFVNGERITSQRLDDGDRVTMGRVSFVIRTRRR